MILRARAVSDLPPRHLPLSFYTHRDLAHSALLSLSLSLSLSIHLSRILGLGLAFSLPTALLSFSQFGGASPNG